MDSSAQVRLVGAGIAGCSTAHHPARLVLVIERGPLEADGRARPHQSNKSLVEGRYIVQPDPWAGRRWSPIAGAEQQATRERVAMYDRTSLARAEVTERGALDLLQRPTTNQPPCYATCTLPLKPAAEIRADIAVTRLDRETFQVGSHEVLRLSYMDGLGWELRASAEFGRRLWDLLEKENRTWGAEMWSLHDPDGADLETDGGDFIGWDALLRRRETAPRRRLCRLTIDDGTALSGSEPVFSDGAPVGATTSTGCSIDDSPGRTRLPAEPARPGTPERVSYFDQRHPATATADPVSDPEMIRMRC
ncbi:glycine cleavage T C-terminal barrel domain-containing protein [Saccharopolyspora sp. NPDC002686]|uniref:glycine cleavage T C-terminal barrel domain-containing protein n=1 Tax=Saccharopolyspora sp. NPDC002686 TaxID=3154541 RepID=UPI00331C8672